MASPEGTGAIILTIPDAPINFLNVPSITASSQIGLSWSDGISNGGTQVIDFTI